MELIGIHGLRKSYGRTVVLDGLSVAYKSGKVYGLIGDNGAGKTTLFDCMLGLTRPDGGEIVKTPGLRVGYLPAEPFFYSLVTAHEYLEFCLKAKGRKIDNGRIEELNRLFKLPLGRYASTYSTGMKKKLALMALLLQDNDLYVLDEPFNGVDLYGVIHLKNIIGTLKAEGKTVVVSSHQISVLHELCDNIDYLACGIIARRFENENVTEIENCLMEDV